MRKFWQNIKEKIENVIGRYAFTRRMVESYGFRTVALASVSFFVSVIFGLYNGMMGILFHSVWYGALAVYYILLALLRGGVLSYQNKRRRLGGESDRLTEAKKYRASGALLLVLNVALSGMMAQMIFSKQGFHYYSWTIYGVATYAFYKVTMSIIHLFKAKQHDDLTVRAIRNFNFVDALVSILSLQTALLFAFASEEIDVSLFNTFTSIGVSGCALGVSISMIVMGNKRVKEIKEEETRGKI